MDFYARSSFDPDQRDLPGSCSTTEASCHGPPVTGKICWTFCADTQRLSLGYSKATKLETRFRCDLGHPNGR
jgi:hypothetical protein